MIFILIMMGYAVIKVFFANLKRGGILLIQIAVGSLYMFSVPRGYIDGFTGWCKQVIGLCLTTFLQATILAHHDQDKDHQDRAGDAPKPPEHPRGGGILRGQFVKISFLMEIGDLVKSNIMQLYPISFAKEMCTHKFC